jgi:hypothetical protein
MGANENQGDKQEAKIGEDGKVKFKKGIQNKLAVERLNISKIVLVKRSGDISFDFIYQAKFISYASRVTSLLITDPHSDIHLEVETVKNIYSKEVTPLVLVFKK